MTTANKITIARILLVPVFIVQVIYYASDGTEWHRLVAILIFGLAALSDGIDGYLARRYGQRSELGAFLDPLADKLLLVSGIVLLSLNNAPHLARLPLWLVATVLSRDALLMLGWVVLHYSCGKVRVRPILMGKAATVLQMACVLWALLKWDLPWLWGLSLAAAICTGLSGLYYVADGVRQLSASPASSPSPKQ
jgi:CDP-diacylglycerol--glycerol-3-phosphate 3-phosphatidyltransferase